MNRAHWWRRGCDRHCSTSSSTAGSPFPPPSSEHRRSAPPPAIERLGSRDSLRRMIERADLSLRPSELVVIAAAGGVSVGLLVTALTGYWWTALITLLVTPAVTVWLLSFRATRRAERFSAQLP